MAEALLVPVRFALYADLMALFGLAVFPLHAFPGSEGSRSLPLRGTALGGALAGLALTGLLTLLLVANMAGVRLAEVDRASIAIVLFETAAGKAIMWRAGVLAALLALSLPPGPFGRLRTAVAACLAAAALATLAWSGHAAAQEAAGAFYLLADVVHLVAGAVWFGALIAFTGLLALTAPGEAERLAALQAALARFSVVGTLLVGAILATGLINAWALVGIDHIPALITALYGRLLLAKIGLFVAMVGLAAVNRFRLTPALGSAGTQDDAAPARKALKRSLALETGAALVIVALVAWLGTLSPLAEG